MMGAAPRGAAPVGRIGLTFDTEHPTFVRIDALDRVSPTDPRSLP